jgi:tetratricopeptide (TPR) repeat protein
MRRTVARWGHCQERPSWWLLHWERVRPLGNGGWIAFSPDDRLVAVGEGFGVIRLVEAETGKEVSRLETSDHIALHPAGFSPDGGRLYAVGKQNGALYIWDLRLIRARLKAMGADWDAPPLPAPKPTPPGPLEVRIVLDDPKAADDPLRQLQAAVERNPKDDAARLNLGNAYSARGKLDEACRSFREAIALQPTNAVAHYCLGNALLRQEKLNDARACYREAIRLRKDYAEAHCNLGSVLQQQGRFAESLAAYRHGHDLGSKRPTWKWPSAAWVRNTERLLALEKKLPAILAREESPAGSEECIELAKVALLKRLYCNAARLYAEGFAAKPALAADPRSGRRYDAARAAVQAAFGEGMDGGAPSEKERFELLRQAWGWLRADLAAWGKQAEADRAAIPHLREALERWRQTPALVNVRDKESLAKLPAERAAWRKLWADVAEVLKQPSGKPTKP